MRKRKVETSANAVTGSITDAQSRYGLGAKSVRDIADECHAVVRIGKSVRYNFQIMDDFMRSHSGR